MSLQLEREVGKFHRDQDQAKAGLARLLTQASKTWRELYGEVTRVQPTKGGAETSKEEPQPVVEQVILRERFTDEEKESLLNDGALIYLPLGTTIPAQREAQKGKNKPSFWYVVDGGDRLLALPSRQIEVAIYPDPERFFVPGSFGKSLRIQEAQVAEDAEVLRGKLGLQGIGEIIPDEASTLTDITFQHLDETGVRLFGGKYGFRYGRTKNPTNGVGSRVAVVGYASADGGLHVTGWGRGRGYGSVGAVRLVVPIVTK